MSIFSPTRSAAPEVTIAGAQAARDLLAKIAATIAPALLTPSGALDWWVILNEAERLATSTKTLLAARAAESHAWQQAGYRSPAEHLADLAGTSISAARDQIAASRRLAGLPATETALRSGELSAAQTTTITDAATANPAAEAHLLDIASHASIHELREEALRAKAAADAGPDATHRRIHAGRYLRMHADTEGAWNLRAHGTIDDGARIEHALAPIIDEIFHNARRSGEPEARDAYAFDALLALTRTSRPAATPPSAPNSDAPSVPGTPGSECGAGTAAATNGSDTPTNANPPDPFAPDPATSSSDSEPNTPLSECDFGKAAATCESDTAARRSSNPTFLTLLRIDLAALVRGALEGDELCEITGLGPIPVRVARDLLGDSIIKLVITRGADVANITHLGRGPTAAQRIALLWQSPACTVEGCNRTRVEIDHRDDWARTHHTRLDELDPLCKHHHDQKHHHGWALINGTGPRRMAPPTDPQHPRNRNPTPAEHPPDHDDPP